MFGSKAWSDKKVRTGIARFLFFTKFLVKNLDWQKTIFELCSFWNSYGGPLKTFKAIVLWCSIFIFFKIILMILSSLANWLLLFFASPHQKRACDIIRLCVYVRASVCVLEYVWARKCVWVWGAGCMFEREREREMDKIERERKEMIIPSDWYFPNWNRCIREQGERTKIY